MWGTGCRCCKRERGWPPGSTPPFDGGVAPGRDSRGNGLLRKRIDLQPLQSVPRVSPPGTADTAFCLKRLTTHHWSLMRCCSRSPHPNAPAGMPPSHCSLRTPAPSACLPSHCLWRFICVHISSRHGHGLRVRETRVQIPVLLCV